MARQKNRDRVERGNKKNRIDQNRDYCLKRGGREGKCVSIIKLSLDLFDISIIKGRGRRR